MKRRDPQNKKCNSRAKRMHSPKDNTEIAGLRIIGGKFRGRKLLYSGDLRTRPMKDRLREAVFNLLGTDVRTAHAIDLFAGTGALGLEALSRGANRATFIEQHFPTAAIIKQNIAALGVAEMAEVVPGNTFIWFQRSPELSQTPWVVFCSPPYEFYVKRTEEMLELVGKMLVTAPEKSVFVVEADGRFDFTLLPESKSWNIRVYPPAVVGLFKKGGNG